MEIRTACPRCEISHQSREPGPQKSETKGFIKICVDAETKQILGAAILGAGGDEVIHVLLDVMYAKAPYTVVQSAMHIHPTVAECLPIILANQGPCAVEGKNTTTLKIEKKT